MARSFLQRLLGLGELPEDVRDELADEGLVLIEEGVRGWVRYRDFRAPGKRFHNKRRWFACALALSEERLVAWASTRAAFELRFDDPRSGELAVGLDGRSTLSIAFDAERFDPECSGKIQYGFDTKAAPRFLEELGARRR